MVLSYQRGICLGWQVWQGLNRKAHKGLPFIVDVVIPNNEECQWKFGDIHRDIERRVENTSRHIVCESSDALAL